MVLDQVAGDQDEVIVFNEKSYMLSNNRITYMQDKTTDDRYFILALVAIAKTIYSHHRDINTIPGGLIQIELLIGLPPVHYGSLRKPFREYFYREGKVIEFEYVRQKYKIAFSEVYVFVQAYAAYFLNASRHKWSTYHKVLLIDIGGITVDYMILRYGSIDKDLMDSLEQGVIKIYQKVKSGVRKKYGILMDEIDIDNILQNNKAVKYESGLLNRVHEIAEEHVIELLGSFREVDIDFRTSLTVFTGGGSILLSQIIEKAWCRYQGEYIIIQDEKANAKGYELQYLAAKGEL